MGKPRTWSIPLPSLILPCRQRDLRTCRIMPCFRRRYEASPALGDVALLGLGIWAATGSETAGQPLSGPSCGLFNALNSVLCGGAQG